MTSPREGSAKRALAESFKYLTAVEIALGPTSVCKAWTQAAQQDELWRWLYYTDFPGDPVLSAHSLMQPKDAYRLSYRKQSRLYSFSAPGNSLYIYNLYHHRATVKAMPLPVYYQQGWKVLANGRLFVCGGINAQGDTMGDVYTIDTERWNVELFPQLPKSRAAPGLGEFKDHIYVFGGIDVAKMARSDRFDPAARRWTALPSMPTSKHMFSVVIYHQKFWLLAFDGVYIEEFDPVSLIYRNLYVRVPYFTSVVAAFAYHDYIYYFGLDHYYRLHLDKDVVDGIAQPYSTPRTLGYCVQTVIFQGHVFLLKHEHPVPRKVLEFQLETDLLVSVGVICSPV
jgi:hypothetical protein